MPTWGRGYVTDSSYTLAFQQVLTPSHIALACALNGVAFRVTPDMSVLDLGCGRGLNVNALAAANTEWTVVGLDYNPAHVRDARDLAAAAGLANAVFVEADLATMTDAAIDSLPEFDLVTLHGVWTWVSDEVRAGIVRLLSRRLKPGGACYIGYNSLPGFGADAALQRVIRHLAPHGAGANAIERAQVAVSRLRQLGSAGSVTGLADTPILRRLLSETSLEPAYIAHEFLTEHWRPVFHEDLCNALAPAKLQFAASATLHENFPDMVLHEAQQKLHDAMPEGSARELAKDLAAQRPFRRDIFVRGRRPVDSEAVLDRIVLAAIRMLPETPPRLVVPAGSAELPPEMWRPIRAALEEGPLPVGKLRRLSTPQPSAAELLCMLVPGFALPLLRATAPLEPARRFNRALADTADHDSTRLVIASPLLAGGLAASWLELAVATMPEVQAQGAAADPIALAAHLVARVDSDERRMDVAGVIRRVLTERAPYWPWLGVIPK